MTHTIFIPDAIRSACNHAAVELGIDPEETLNTFCVPLVPADGPDDAEATHWGACGSIPETAREYLADNLDQFPGAMWWRWDSDKRLVASSEPGDLGKFWGWENCLTEVGLKRQITPLELP